MSYSMWTPEHLPMIWEQIYVYGTSSMRARKFQGLSPVHTLRHKTLAIYCKTVCNSWPLGTVLRCVRSPSYCFCCLLGSLVLFLGPYKSLVKTHRSCSVVHMRGTWHFIFWWGPWGVTCCFLSFTPIIHYDGGGGVPVCKSFPSHYYEVR